MMNSTRRLYISRSAVSLFVLACLIAAAGWVFFDGEAAAQAPANQPPEFIHAVKRGVDENSAAGTNVGRPVTASDPDGDTITYSLSGSGSDLFTIDDGGQITVGEGTELDHETTPSYAVTVHADDGNGGTASVNITVNVRDVDENNYPPQFIHAIKRGVFENSAAGTNVGKPVTASDPNGDAIAYSLSGTGADLFTIDANGQIKVAEGTSLDHETTPSYAVTVHADDGNGGTDSVPITINVKDVEEEEQPPTVSVTGAIGGPESGSLTFGLERTGDASDALTVSVSISETGSMLASNPPTVAEFAAGSATTTLAVTLDNDAVDEADSTVTLTLQAGDGYDVGSSAALSATVTDDDLPTVTIEADSASVSEAAGPATFTLTRNGVLSEILTVNVGISETESMLAGTQPATAIFAANSATATLEAALDDDDLDEPDSVVTASVTAGDGYETGTPSAATVNVTDDDEPAIDDPNQPPDFIHAIKRGVFENSAAGTNVGVPVTANDPDGDTITYNLSGTGANLFTIDANGQIKVAEGTSLDHETTPSYAVTVHADDGNGGTDSVPITINVKDVEEEETAPVAELPTVSAVSATGGPESGSLTFGLERTGDAAAALTVSVSITETGDMLAANPPTAADFAAGSATTTLAVDLDDDAVDEADSTVTLTLQAGDGYDVGSSSAATIVNDDDLPSVTIEADSSSVSEAAGPAAFTLTRNGVLSEILTVNVGISETESMLAGTQPATAIFAAGSATATLEAALDDDDADEADSVVTATVAAGDGYEAGTPSTATLNVTDDDLPTVTIEADGASVSEAAGPATFTLTRNGVLSEILTVNVGISETESMLAGTQPATAIFAAGSATVTLEAALDDDGADEPDSVVTATVAAGDGYDVGSASSATITVTDDDLPEVALSTVSGGLVNNTGQTAATAIGSASDVAQAFTTGSNAGGYALEGVDVYLTIGSNAAAPGTMRLLSDDSGSPGGVIQTFKDPAPCATGLNTYSTRTTAVILSPNTTYWLMWDNSAEHDHTLSATTSDGEDAGAAAGWSIGDALHFKGRDAGAWTADTDSRAVRFRLQGNAAAAPAGGKLVGNRGQSPTVQMPWTGSYDYANWFSTGNHPGGYVLTGLTLDMTTGNHANTNGTDLAVSIRAADGARPAAGSLVHLLPPAQVGTDGAVYRVPGDGIDLTPNTAYWVYVDTLNPNAYRPKATTSKDEDADSATDWNIGYMTRKRDRHDGYVFRRSHALAMELQGYARPAGALPWVSIAANNPNVSEGADQATFTLTRFDGDHSQELTVNVSVTETGPNVLAADQPITAVFAANSATTTLNVTLDDENDDVLQADSVVTAAVQAGSGYSVAAPSKATVTVDDDDLPVLTVTAEPVNEGRIDYFVTRTGDLSLSVSFNASIWIALNEHTPRHQQFEINIKTQTLPAGTRVFQFMVRDFPIRHGHYTLMLKPGDGYKLGDPSEAAASPL